MNIEPRRHPLERSAGGMPHRGGCVSSGGKTKCGSHRLLPKSSRSIIKGKFLIIMTFQSHQICLKKREADASVYFRGAECEISV